MEVPKRKWKIELEVEIIMVESGRSERERKELTMNQPFFVPS